MIPLTAVGRTAGAVSGIADCGMVVRMTRGRGWIVVLGMLLGGIVALNVWGLGLGASSSATAAKIEAFQRDNGVLRGRIANRLSNGAIESAATRLGLAVPAPDAVHYLEGSGNDFERAAERLANGKITAAPVSTPTVADEAVLDPAAAVEIPAETLPVEPVPTEPVAVEPVATDPAVVEPATVAPVTAPAPVTDPATGAVAP